MKKLLLHEDMFFDIPNVDYKLDTELELKGPEPGEDVGVSGLLLDLIGDVAKNINDYNQLQANLENYPEVAEMIKDFADEENMKLGKIQSALKTISPNAEYIMNGAVEADQEMDPGSPIDESLKESFDEYYQINILTDMFDADPSRFEQALEDFGYNPTNYDNFYSFLKDVDKVDLLNKFADLLQKNDELNSSWYNHFDFTEAPLPFDFDESLNESFDPKDYNQALDDYMSSKNISVEKIFGALNYDDPRYIQLFNSLKDLGYKPRETGTYSRGYSVPAMTITVATREVPEDVVDLIHDLNGVTGRHIGFHKGAHNWKLKFELRDDDFSSFKDELLQSLDESLNEDVTDIPLSTMFKMNPDKFAQFCRQEGWLQNMSRDEWQYLQYDIAHEGRKLFALANDIKHCGTHRNLSTQEIAETLFGMMQDENNNMVESLKRKLRKKFKETLDNGKIDSREDDILDKVFAYLRQEKGDEEFVEFAKKTLGLTDSELKTFCGLCEGYDESKYIVWYNLDGEENYIIISALNEDDAVDDDNFLTEGFLHIVKE